jgi:NADH:ubiquinone oxidoreductase subunit 3 (subunit A)
MEAVLYSPPVIFAMFLVILILGSNWLSRFAKKGNLGEHALDSYACGQRNVENHVNPDYSQFYQYAFVFTVAHVLILVVATAPADARFFPVVYIISGMLSILIIFRR